MRRKPPDSGKLQLVKAGVEKPAENVEKSARKTVGRPFVPNDPRSGRGPKKGAPNAGRPPDAWKARMAQLADRWAIAAEAKRVLDNPDHPQWMAAGKTVIEQAHGSPAKRVELAGDGDQPLTIRIVREI